MKTFKNKGAAKSAGVKTKEQNINIKRKYGEIWKDRKRHSSIASRISSFYTNMFATWMSLSLVVIYVLVIGFNVIYTVFDTKPYVEELRSYKTTAELADRINSTESFNAVLMDENGNIVTSSFSGLGTITNYKFFGVDFGEKKVYLIYSESLYANGENTYLQLYYDITLLVLELLIIGASAVLLFLISILTIYVRGHYLTKKAFSVMDELILKANSISSQNLNLRLNVSDSTDELVEFALTFNRMMDRIESAYKKQNQFVSDASHELRTPIAVIQGYARMLERWGKEDKEILQESIDAINKEAKAMQDLVEKLLFIARNDKDTLVLIKDKFDMSELMNEFVRETQMLGSKHVIESSVEPGVIVFGDRDRIKQALRIFVDNALKYTPPEGKITLRLTREEGYAVTVIKDTGMGIPEEDLSKVFDRFYRVDTAREREKGGSGLGLSIARIIVLRHGGKIRVASKEGKGTRFSIYWPLS